MKFNLSTLIWAIGLMILQIIFGGYFYFGVFVGMIFMIWEMRSDPSIAMLITGKPMDIWNSIPELSSLKNDKNKKH